MLVVSAAMATGLAGCAAHTSARPDKPPGATPVAPAAPLTDAMRAAIAAVLQGDGRGAVSTLRAIDAAALAESTRALRACMLDRLDARRSPPIALDDAYAASVLAAYREYWWRSLRAEHAAADNEAELLAALNAIVVADGGSAAASMDAVEPLLLKRIEAHGRHALFGRTLPLREFMLWSSQTTRHYDVALPQAKQPVTVYFMDDFASLGWAGFASCERVHSGGWTKPEGLYAVRSAYDIASETFSVSYLAHEAQHYWDNAHFPMLEQPELEYRAKLVEIASARATLPDLLAAFASNTSDDRGVPHSHANERIVRELRTRLLDGDAARAWTSVDSARINAAAAELLAQDTQRLRVAAPRVDR
jgi:hypothetical protein